MQKEGWGPAGHCGRRGCGEGWGEERGGGAQVKIPALEEESFLLCKSFKVSFGAKAGIFPLLCRVGPFLQTLPKEPGRVPVPCRSCFLGCHSQALPPP